MNRQIKSVLKKTAKIAGVTCIAAGAVAIVTSGTALKAIGEGGKYLVNTVKKIMEEPAVSPAIIHEAEAVSETDFAEPSL